MTESGRKKLGEDLHVLLGIAMARYDLSEEEAIDALDELKEEVESGQFDVFFAASKGGRDTDSDGDPE